MARSSFYIAAIGLLLVFTSGLHAATYKCTDASGNTQYTAVPPKGADCQSLSMRGNAPAKATEKPETPAPKQTKKTEYKPASNEDIARINDENCERARANLKLLSSSTRIRLKEGDEYRVIPEEERQQKIGLAQEQVDTYCK